MYVLWISAADADDAAAAAAAGLKPRRKKKAEMPAKNIPCQTNGLVI